MRWLSLVALIVTGPVCVSSSQAQSQAPDWQAQVRKYAEAKDWNSVMRLVEQEIAQAPQDVDVRAWRARVLAWSGKLPEAEKEYVEILKVSRTDADNWMGLASVYLREGKLSDAQRAISRAEELDPKRPDIHAARARILRAEGQRKEAQSEFQYALHLDPGSTEAREGLVSVRRRALHELRFGQDNDLLSYATGLHDEWMSLASQWTSHWTTSVTGNFYQRSGVEAGKFSGSITRRQSKWGALTAGGAVGRDNAVIPKNEAFFDVDHGWKTGETGFVRGVEFSYAQLVLVSVAANPFSDRHDARPLSSKLDLHAWSHRLKALSRGRTRSGGLREPGALASRSRAGATASFQETFPSRPELKTSQSWIRLAVFLRRLTAADCDCRSQTART